MSRSIFALVFALQFSFAAFAQQSSQTDFFRIGKPSSGANKVLEFNAGSGSTNPKIRWNVATNKIELTNDGSTYTAIISASGVPAGAIYAFAGSTCPTGSIPADGTAQSRTTYAILFAAIGNTWGNGDGSTTFNVPLLNNGTFPRGVDLAVSNDADRATRTNIITGTFTVGGGATTSSSSTVTVTSTAELVPGMTVTGTNIPSSSYVRAILSGTTFTLGTASNNANVNATGSSTGLTFTFAKGASGNYVGSSELAAYLSHGHPGSTTTNTVYYGTTGSIAALNGAAFGIAGISGGTQGYVSQGSGGTPAPYVVSTTTIAASGGTETRPVNVAVLYCVRTGL